MKKMHILSQPAKVNDVLSFDELYDEISHGWQEKARQLQARRWRAIRRSSQY